MHLLEVKGLEKTFKDKKTVFQAVKGIDFYIDEGECLGIVGESGCGKSTTANLVARLLKESNGEIFFRGCKINEGKRLKCIGRELQMVFQNPKDSFDPRYTVLQSVMMGADSYGLWTREELRRRSMEMLAYVGLKDSYADKRISGISGGECQRVAIARALVCEPKLIIFDEATSALDVSVQAQILQLMKKLKEEKKVSFLFITHDLTLTASICDRLAVMYSGRIVETGRTKDILNKPEHPYTKRLLSAVLPLDMSGSYRLPLTERFRDRAEHGCEFYEFCCYAKEECRREISDKILKNGRNVRCLYPVNREEDNERTEK